MLIKNFSRSLLRQRMEPQSLVRHTRHCAKALTRLLLMAGFAAAIHTSPALAVQTLGVGGVATPGGATLITSDTSSQLNITSGGTSTSPRVYDGQGHTVGRINITASYVVVQNFRINAGSQYGAFINANNVTFQNNDIKGVKVSGDGDLNAITAFGNNITIQFNTAINFVSGDPGSSHTDFIQTWVSSSHPTASANWKIIANKAVGPANPSRLNGIPSIHQCVMAEGLGRGGNSGGSGDPHDWIISDNEFGDSWNQCIKLDGVDNVAITRNKFTGTSSKIFDISTASSNVKVYSDNTFGSGYGLVGYTITSGAGPGTPPSGGGGGTPFVTGARGTILGMNNLCVDVFGANTADGTPIGIYTCNGNMAQQWKPTAAHELRNPMADKCMGIGNGGTSVDGAPIVEWTCGGQSEQKWNYFNMEVVAGNSGKCIDVPNSNFADGQAVQLYDCNGTAAQKVGFEAATGEIKSSNGKCFDVAGSNSNNGTVVQLWACNGTAAQRWIPGNGGFRTALNTNRCLDLAGNGTANGTKVEIWDCLANGPAQQFALRGEVKNQGGKCLDIPNSNAVAGQALQLWTCNGTSAQRWSMWLPN
jgi:hypothetical protein